MIKVSTDRQKRSWLWPMLLVSFLIHSSLYGFSDYIEKPARKSYAPSSVEVQVKKTPVSKPLHEPEAPVKKIKPKPISPKKHVKKAPKPNKKPETSPQPQAEAPKPVFGVTADSLAKGDSGVAVRVGNTLEKEMEKDFTPPEKIAALPAAPKKQKPVPMYELTRTPSFKSKIEPHFPEEVRREGIEGIVQLELLIDENGRVRKIRVLKSPDMRLAKSAVAAAKKSLFNPGLVGRQAVPVKIKVPYRFVLDS